MDHVLPYLGNNRISHQQVWGYWLISIHVPLIHCLLTTILCFEQPTFLLQAVVNSGAEQYFIDEELVKQIGH